MATDEVEDKFLAAIAANPNDREARSVYADWLDERGDPRGEYLRLELQLHEIPERLAALAPHIEESWIVTIARTCDVLLLEAGANKIGVIKVIREVTGFGLRDSKDLADLASHPRPSRIRERITVEEAHAVAAKFADTTALVRILAHDGTLEPPRDLPSRYGVTSNPPSPNDAGFAVVITAIPTANRIATIKTIRELTGLGLKDAKDIIDRVPAEPQTLFASVGRDRANLAADRLRVSCTVEVRPS